MLPNRLIATLAIALLALLALLPPFARSAHAADPYLGASLATPGEAYLAIGPGAAVQNDRHSTSYKLYGGLRFGSAWSLEAGYGNFGRWGFADPAQNSRDRAEISAQALMVAARYTVDLGQHVAAFGKLGLAANRFRYRDANGASARDNFVRPMWGIGIEAKLSDRLSVPLEFEYLGAARTQFGKFRQEKLELGLRLSF